MLPAYDEPAGRKNDLLLLTTGGNVGYALKVGFPVTLGVVTSNHRWTIRSRRRALDCTDVFVTNSAVSNYLQGDHPTPRLSVTLTIAHRPDEISQLSPNPFGGVMKVGAVAQGARIKILSYIVSILLAVIVILPTASRAAERLLVVNSALNMLTVPLWVAKENGYFHKYGLDVDTIYIPSGTMGMQAMLAGETKILAADGGSVVNARLHGAPVKIFIGMVNFYPNPFFSTPEIKSYADLKGKKIAVTRVGSSSYTATTMLMKKLGLEENRDYTILQLGSTQNRLAALTKGLIQGTTLSAPESVIAQKAGMKVLISGVELAKLGITIQHQSANVMESSLHGDFRPKLKAFAMGYLEGVRQVYRSKEYTVEVLKKYTRVTDPEVLSASYDESYQAIDKEGSLIDAGIQAQLNDLAKTDPRAKSARPSDFFDASIINELAKEGFIKALWASK
jgi:sulfonate transport system substrate-binding protein